MWASNSNSAVDEKFSLNVGAAYNGIATGGKVDAGVAVLLTEDKCLVSTDQPNAIDPVYGLLSGP